MTNCDQDSAVQIRESFKASLSDTARANITPAQFEELENAIRLALSRQLATATDAMEQTISQLRRRIEKREIEL
jgi:hypothetical protein